MNIQKLLDEHCIILVKSKVKLLQQNLDYCILKNNYKSFFEELYYNEPVIGISRYRLLISELKQLIK